MRIRTLIEAEPCCEMATRQHARLGLERQSMATCYILNTFSQQKTQRNDMKWQGWWLIAYMSNISLTVGSPNHPVFHRTSNIRFLNQPRFTMVHQKDQPKQMPWGFICTNAAILVGFLMPLSATYEHKYIWIRLSKKRNVNNYKTNVKMSMAKTQRIPTCTLQTTSPYGSGFTIPFSNLRFHLGTWSNGKSVHFFSWKLNGNWALLWKITMFQRHMIHFLGISSIPQLCQRTGGYEFWISSSFIVFHIQNQPKSRRSASDRARYEAAWAPWFHRADLAARDPMFQPKSWTLFRNAGFTTVNNIEYNIVTLSFL